LFTAWVVVALIWLWVALIVANFYPLIDGGAKQIWTVLKGETKDAARGAKGSSDGVNSPQGELVTQEVVTGEK
jgi:hypothetical protein